MWLANALGEDFTSPSEMRSILEMDADEGTTVRKLFNELAGRYRPIEETIFSVETKRFSSNVVVLFNDRVISLDKVYEKVLKNGDKIKVLPIYAGG